MNERHDHANHVPILERLEAALAAGQDLGLDQELQAGLASCLDCQGEADMLVDAARRLRSASAALDLDVEPTSAVRARVRIAALGSRPTPADVVHSDRSPVQRAPGQWFGRLAWAGAGAGLAAVVVAVALTVGRTAPPAHSSFVLIGADLAPVATGIAELRPVDGGSVAMTLEMSGLPASKPGEFYELWWVGPDKRHVSCGTFRSDGTPVDLAFTSGVDITTTVLIEVTLEQDDGDATPGPHVAQSPTS